MRGIKVISFRDNIITLRVNGRMLAYFVDRPQPLSPTDAAMLRGIMDTTLYKAMYDLELDKAVFGLKLSRLFSCLVSRWRYISRTPAAYLLGRSVADFIESVGVVVDVDKKTKALVLLKSDVEKIRKGEYPEATIVRL